MENIFLIDLSSFIIILLLLFFHLHYSEKKEKTTNVYTFILVSIALFSFSNGAFQFAAEHSIPTAAYVFKVIATISFSLVATMYAVYAYVSIKKTAPIKKAFLYPVCIPCVVNVAFLIINYFTNICFTIDETGVTYHFGYAFMIADFVFIMVYVPLLAIRYRKTLYHSFFQLLLCVGFLALGFGIFELGSFLAVGRFISGTSLFFAVITTYIFLRLLRNRMNIDASSGLYLRNQCLLDLKHANGSSVYLIQILGFHHYSDEAGNEILLTVVDYLKRSIPKCTMYRMASDQIAIKTDMSDDIHNMQNINQHFKNYIMLDGESIMVKIKASAIQKMPHNTPEQTLHYLESMITMIKDTQNTYIIYNKSLEDVLKDNEENTKNVMHAISQDGVIPYYQGIYSMDDGRIIWCEALARLKVKNEILSPARFLPVLFNNNCIDKLDRDILIKVLKEMHRFKTDNPDADIRGISFNFTSEDFLNVSFMEEVKQLIVDNEIDPNMICFELCESTVVQNYEKVKAIMTELRNFGIKFFLDDFGIGFSNLSAVLNLPFHLIKIDKSLLDAARYNKLNVEILNGVVRAINSVGLKTLVEGVETEEDLDIVKSAGAHYIQGFYFHKPSDLDELCESIHGKKN